MIDEKALIEAAQSGDANAFEALLELHYDTIYRFAMKWCGNEVDAEDIAQLASIKLARGIRQFKFESAFTSWLYRLVINCAKDWRRQQQRHETQTMNTGEYEAIPENYKPDSGVYLRQVLAILERLGEGVKETVLLVFAEGLSHGEAASILNVKESTVSWRIHQVRKKLSFLSEQQSGQL